MKKIYSVLLLAVALVCMPFWVNAETLGPLYDGTNTYGEYVPLEGNYADYYQRVQVLYPATDLSAMAGKSITKMTFYLRTKATKAWNAGFEIALAETEAANLDASSTFLSETFTTVYSGSDLNGMGDVLEITFSEPFVYSGTKNLLFELREVTKGSYSKTIFAGKGGYDNNFSNYKNSSSSYASITSGTRRAFIPKTLFTYEDAGSASCAKPTLTPGDVTAKTAAFSWTAGGEETQWQYVCLPATEKVNW